MAVEDLEATLSAACEAALVLVEARKENFLICWWLVHAQGILIVIGVELVAHYHSIYHTFVNDE